MKNHITTIITTVSSCIATLSFLAIFNPSAINLKAEVVEVNKSSIALTTPSVANGHSIESKLLFPASTTNAFGTDPFLGEITMFAGNFAPRGWAFCDGQLLAIAQNDALFSILGTIYGGDGRTTFALPDLRGRTPIHAGSGSGLTQRTLGSKGGAETTTRSAASSVAGPGRTGNVNAAVVSGTGVENNMPPYQTVNYIIALQGVYPPRS